MTAGQIVMAAGGAVALGVGIWLLTRGSSRDSAKPSEARLPVVSVSGPPGLLLALVGLFMLAFPFTPWWPAGEEDSNASGATAEEPLDGEDGGPMGGFERVQLEAEDGMVAAPMEVFSDETASGGGYVSSATRNQGSTTLTFTVNGGKYWVWGRVAVPAGGGDNTNSVRVFMDDEEGDIWDFFEATPDSLAPGAGWQWDRLSLRCAGDFDSHACDPWTPVLAGGSHSLRLEGREAASLVDALVITNDPQYTP